jgi:hypothetical protein
METVIANEEAIRAHAASDREDLVHLRSLSMQERSTLLASACAAAAAIQRSRIAAGLGEAKPAPWPDSTWEFLRKHAADARGETVS